ncbi:UNVERIFIED_CONTAM: hypothetical protein FKN15_012320 [Acipenser sinensis]
MTAKGKGKAPYQRDDIQLIFSCYAPRGKNLSAQDLLDFIQKEQMNSQADMKAVEQIIENYEINKTAHHLKERLSGCIALMELKNKILIKNKKIGLLQDTILKKGTNRHGEVGHYIEEDHDEEEAEEETAKDKTPALKPAKVEE